MCGFFRPRKNGTDVLERDNPGSSNYGSRQLRAGLDGLLDRVLQVFAPASDLMAEVLLAIPGANQVITTRLRPDTSAALPIRVRAGEGSIGQVYASGRPLAGDISPQTAAGTGSQGDIAHLLRSQSHLVVPLIDHGKTLGVLNIEAPRPGVFAPASIKQLTDSKAYKDLLAYVAHSKQPELTEEQIARDLIDKLQQQIAFAIDPEDPESTYYQILQVSAQIVSKPDVSAGLILVRNDSLQLAPVAGGSSVAAVKAAEKNYWAVRAARLGAFNSDVEWELEGRSIARRVIEQRRSALVPDVGKDPDYRDSGTGFKESSELIVPLLDEDTPIGVIGLVCPQLNAFTPADQAHLEEVARVAVEAITRSEQIRSGQRAELQLQFASELQRDLQELFPEDVTKIASLDLEDFQQRIYKGKILQWVREQTHSDSAAIVLKEVTLGHPTYLTVHADLGEHQEKAPPRWLASQGVTGNACTSGKTVNVHNLDQLAAAGGEQFVPYYVGVHSEVAAPMKRGDETIGVLDVESKSVHHYTTEYVRWVEFFAEQTAFALIAIALARKTQLELRLEQLSRDLSQRAQDIRHEPEDKLVRPMRDDMLRRVLQEVRDITGSAVGRILIAMNAYTADDAIDTQRGVMYYMISTDPNEVAESARRYFPITNGASGLAFRQAQDDPNTFVVFNDLASRPPKWFSASERMSGLFIPVSEGTRIVGVVDFEADRQDAYPPDFVTLGQRATDMISTLLVVTRMRLRRSTTELRREFETEILRIDKPDLDDLMKRVLENTAILSDIEEGWGRLVLLRPSTDPKTLVASRTFDMTYSHAGSQFIPGPEDDRTPIDFAVFQEALQTKRPVLILDTDLMSPDDRTRMPWPAARSMICVPLLSPTESDDTTEHATGFLAVASPRRSEFSEADKEALGPFAQTIVSGLRSIQLLGARKSLMEEVSHDFGKALPSLFKSMTTVRETLQAAQAAPDLRGMAQRHVTEANDQMEWFSSLVNLTSSMLDWFFSYADEDLTPENDPAQVLDVTRVIADLEKPVNALAQVRSEFTVRWIPPSEPLQVLGGKFRKKLIEAVLFKFLDNAIKYSEADDISVSITRATVAGSPQVVFAVSNSGRPIDLAERPLLFQLKFRPSRTNAEAIGSGIGLYQARQIAHRLGGEIAYDADATGHNIFSLSLPLAGSRLTERRA